MSVFINPSARTGCDTRSIFKWSLATFFFFKTDYHTKAKETSLTYYLLIVWGRIHEFTPFPIVLALFEMQGNSFRTGTRVAVSISFDDIYYTTIATETECKRATGVLNRLLQIYTPALLSLRHSENLKMWE